ncbi:hypothetical protein H0E87_008964 [Populus deltoides]|uniref:GRAM domain-containing protein n=1 Tax=Populus deltoides TaxID=3696 RepID=A0A8T2Z2R8_POPDE|nr:hypothetical protein H0E87_008964 [Populus deltoides]
MHLSKFISRPCFEPSGTPSSTDHHGDEVDTAGGSRTFANIIRDRVRSVGLSDSIKFEAKKIKEGGKKNIFKQKFEVREGEKLLKASHCSLSTEAGPVAGLLFISTEKVAFCSQRSVTFKSPDELLEETDRKIEIPIRNIRGVDLNESQKKKMTIIIEDSSEFLFMDFLRYDKARQNLEEAILWQSCQAERS